MPTVASLVARYLKKPVRWRRLLLEVLLFGVLFTAIDQWLSRNLLTTEQAAPVSVLPTLAGTTAALPVPGKRVLIYFFAPWCTVCHLSIGNLAGLAAQQPELSIQLVALSYDSVEEVQQFVADKKLPFPVLLGNAASFNEWQLSGFPSYYLVDETGNIRARNMGYSSQVGLWVRSMF